MIHGMLPHTHTPNLFWYPRVISNPHVNPRANRSTRTGLMVITYVRHPGTSVYRLPLTCVAGTVRAIDPLRPRPRLHT